jgi:hypothetical protein
MEPTTIIRIAAAVLAVIVAVTLIQRRRARLR